VIRTISRRKPTTYDYLAFYVGIPLLFGILATPFAVPPQGEVNFFVIAYVCFRAVTFWFIIDVACRCIGNCMSRFKLPLWGIFSLGFMLAGAIIYLFVFVALQTSRFKNPDIAAYIGHENMGWNLEYMLTVASYSAPAFILWFLSAYGYRRAFNVELFSYAPDAGPGDIAAADVQEVVQGAVKTNDRTPTFLSDSSLPSQSRVLAIKAEEHYIRVWTNNGNDLLRYRFKDAVNELGDIDGLQVHRSWWICLSSIDQMQSNGRKAELRLKHDNLVIPVSLSYKQAVSNALERRNDLPDIQAGGSIAS